jgi:hypothetical protein
VLLITVLLMLVILGLAGTRHSDVSSDISLEDEEIDYGDIMPYDQKRPRMFFITCNFNLRM